MKMRKLLLGLAMAATLVAGSLNFSTTSYAEAYTYTVELCLAGSGSENAHFTHDAVKHITVARTADTQAALGAGYNASIDGDKLVIRGLQYGDRVDFDEKDMVVLDPVTVTDADGNTTEVRKYVVSGIRKSGNNDKVSQSSFEVTKDTSYVVAYGVGTVVPYTVEYKDASGKALRESDTYYGLLNQETFVSYKYIDGYVPNAYNYQVKSLKENQVITFTYTPGSRANTTTTVNDGTSYSYSYVGGGTSYEYQTVVNPAASANTASTAANNNGNAGANGGNNAEAAQDNAGAGGGADEEAAEDGTTSIDDEATPTAPEDTITIEDEDVSKAGGLSEATSHYVLICIIIIALAVIVFVVVFVLMKKRQNAIIASTAGQEKKEQ